MNSSESAAMLQAIQAARTFEGATAPNPCVGAVGLTQNGDVLGVAAHEGAGKPHAEAALIAALTSQGLMNQLHTMVVTLEPCNHEGRTPSCVRALIDAHKNSALKRIVFGSRDPNPRVEGGGAQILTSEGLKVEQAETPEVRDLNAPFVRLMTRGLPWITVKSALRDSDNRIPPVGQKTFTQPSSLRLAHELRRRSDAIITGSGTVMADSPLFTVRHLPDHAWRAQPRILAVLDRRRRVSSQWIAQARANGFDVWCPAEPTLPQLFKLIGQKGALRVLVEAGDLLTQSVLECGLWSEHVVIHHFSQEQGKEQREDEIHVYRNH